MMATPTGGYALSPLQAGMLYQSLLAEGHRERAGYDIEQIRICCNEKLDIESFEYAWNQLTNRYSVLTNRFQWKGVPQPIQIPCPGAHVPLQVVDWTLGDVESLRAEFLFADRLRGFTLDEAPLMRVTVALLPNNRCEIVWTVHHILVDERSFTWLLHEVFDIYSERTSGWKTCLPGPEPAFNAYIDWLDQCNYDNSRDFFKDMLAGKRSPTPLPLAEPIARSLSTLGHGAANQKLDAHTYDALMALAARHGVEMSVVVMSAWAVMLARLTGDDDVIFGITRSCRYSALGGAATAMIGLLINTLPARFKIDDDAELGDFFIAVRQCWVAQWGHEHMSLMQLQGLSEMGPGVPLFETLVMYKNRDLNSELRKHSGDWLQRECELYEQPSVPLTLIATDVQGLDLRLLFDRRRFSAEIAQRLLSYLTTTLTSMAQCRKVAEIEIMPAAERQQVIYGWNATERSFNDKRLIHQLFEARVDLVPDAVAVQVGEATYTFAEVEVRANRLANALRQRGIKHGQYVGVCLSRDIGLVVALLGIAKSGAAYLPVDPEAPRDRISFMVADANVQLVVTEPAYQAMFDCATLDHLLDQSDAAIQQASDARPVAEHASTDACYAIFTSGSTGKPKGVVLTHRAVVNTLEWVSETFGVKPGDRALFVTSPCFDLSVYDVFGILGAGATVVVATTEDLREPRKLVRLLIDQRITIWDSAPAALQRLTALFPSEVTANNSIHLRLAMLSGDWIPLALPDLMRTAFSNVQVMSLGGATEAAIWSNWFSIGEIDRRWSSIPYGRPIQNAQYYVLDKRKQPVPVGVTGDLYISGTCLAEGYLNRAELTQERFVANPFRAAGERMYMTGDLARFFPDGNLEFLGRADFQVKIRGYRIELGEIEATLANLAGVSEAVCTAYDDISGAKALVAYLTFKSNAALDETLIKESLRKVLPDYMVPARIVVLDAMPLSSNGKLDRKALPSPLEMKTTTDYVEPTTETDRRLVAVWQRVLKIDRIGMTDNFFAQGGDSLVAVLLAVEIEKEFAINFPLARVLEHPTPKTMTTVLGKSVVKNKHLVTLNAQGSRVPLVLFSGIGGFGFFFHNLAESLGSDQPVHVLHAVGAEDAAEGTHHTIEAMADIYAPQILAACPQQTLILGGYSFGALFAYELAKRLTKLGKQIPLIVSFDGTAPGHPRLLPLAPRLLKHFTDWLALDLKGKVNYLGDRFRNLRLRLVGLEKDDRFLPVGIDPAMAERIGRVTAGLWRARDVYKPTERIQSDLLLFKAEVPFEWPGCVTDEDYGWGAFVSGDIRLVAVEGEHLRLFSRSNDLLMSKAINAQIAELALNKA